ncbi:hypothetical protein D9Q98_007851 [Chlorella vulgaris]|uniref:Uncharacterized protein n=1 Tax=Chlorella vulgaris TaxID=3077 RepID=A0A9D4YTK3_CHLVU|nr:hypothetical protein D9Q98_007851 [Chlorella vulgaris]
MAHRCKCSPQVELQVWDVVRYNTNITAPSSVALGRVSRVEAAHVTIERLEEDPRNLVWLVSHSEEDEQVPLEAVVSTVEADYLQLVDPDRVSNPHGEHAIEAYRLLEPLDAGAAAAAAK